MAEADEAVCSDNLTGLTLSKALMKDPIGFVPAPNWVPEILEQLDQSHLTQSKPANGTALEMGDGAIVA